ncbi:MAG: PepSY domain-containing protein [Pseudomonadota bacterium]
MNRLTLALFLSLLASGLSAQPWSEGGWQSAQNGTITTDDLMGDDDPRLLLTLDEAVAQVRSETGGRVLSAKTVRQNGLRVYRIKVLTPQKQVVIHEIEAE